MTWEDLAALARVHPEVTGGGADRPDALLVNGAVLAVHDPVAGTVRFPEAGGAALALARLTPTEAQRLIGQGWRRRASPAAVAAFDRERIGGV